MVDFKLSEEQVALRQLARDFVNNKAKPIVAGLDLNLSFVSMPRLSKLFFALW